ncbi:unnamed protein product [Arctia plantaginis]|uniref:SMB domain-containing protein n=1 Tax=Arctia plantaginis TaxID=874455 RepID=A0A8S1B0T6_ARCPL|nr:unnamed protein product [Arctia plantaginis]
MAYTLPISILLCGVIGLSLAYSGPDLPPGPYCGRTNECCKNREDRCSHYILGTMCYCDEFCDRPNGRDDCCPDYQPVCDPQSTPPPGEIKKPDPCRHGGRIYRTGDTRKEGCNTCECVFEYEQNNWQCSRDPCIIDDDVISYVNRDYRLGWRASNYSQFYNKKLKDGLIFKLGTFKLSQELYHLGAVNYDKDIDYPRQFDSRQNWANFITPVVDQGWCGSDWAVSLATIISDRFAIQSKGAERVRLSPQTLLSCNVRRQQGCKGGHIDTAWRFASVHGMVDEDCYPYKARVTTCPFRAEGNLLSDGCRPLVADRQDRYKVGPPSRLVKEQDVMYDIMVSGPIQAVMTVYQDFFHYSGGIYRHSMFGDQQMKGYHSVRIVGWGEQNGDKYWLVANSWGPEWGENGYFRIARGVNESGIESFMVSVLCDVTESSMK